MKKLLLSIIAIISLISFQTNNIYAQCTPNSSCVDTDNPGEICPDTLPDGTIGIQYTQVVTIIPPATADVNGSTVNIHHITLDNVQNIPNGLTYTANATEMYPGNSYCVLISGTPTVSDTFKLKIYVTPYVEVMGTPVATTQQIDSTSLFIYVAQSAGIEYNSLKDFELLETYPNPFTFNTQIGFYTKSSSQVNLDIFDVLGNKVYSEQKNAIYGKYYFDFTGENLKKGIYIYNVTTNNKIISKRFVKQ